MLFPSLWCVGSAGGLGIYREFRAKSSGTSVRYVKPTEFNGFRGPQALDR